MRKRLNLRSSLGTVVYSVLALAAMGLVLQATGVMGLVLSAGAEGTKPACDDPECEPSGGEGGEEGTCEHGVAIIECQRCRYEVGVVRVEEKLGERLLGFGTVEEKEISHRLALTGKVELDRTRVVDVPPLGLGRVTRILNFLGDRVEKGDVLLHIHSSDYAEAKASYLRAHVEDELARKEFERQSAIVDAVKNLVARLREPSGSADIEAELGGIQAGERKGKLLSALARFRHAQMEWKRQESLGTDGVASAKTRSEAHKDYLTAKAEYMAALEELEMGLGVERLRAENALRRASTELWVAEKKLRLWGLDDEALEALRAARDDPHFAEIPVRAPQSGTIIAQTVSEGEIVDPSRSMCTIADLSSLWVWCDLYHADLARLEDLEPYPGTLAATVRVAAVSETGFVGTVDLVGSSVDERTRTVKVRVRVSNAHGKLRPGMLAEVEIPLPSVSMRVVPGDAVMTDGGKAFVFEHLKDDLWIRRDVETGRQVDGLTEIISGCRAGARIVTRGAFMLKSDILREKMGAGCAD